MVKRSVILLIVSVAVRRRALMVSAIGRWALMIAAVGWRTLKVSTIGRRPLMVSTIGRRPLMVSTIGRRPLICMGFVVIGGGVMVLVNPKGGGYSNRDAARANDCCIAS